MGKKKERIRELEHAIKAVSEAYAHTIDTVDALKKERDGLREQLNKATDPEARAALRASRDATFEEGRQVGQAEVYDWLGNALDKDPAYVWDKKCMREEAETLIRTAKSLQMETK